MLTEAQVPPFSAALLLRVSRVTLQPCMLYLGVVAAALEALSI